MAKTKKSPDTAQLILSLLLRGRLHLSRTEVKAGDFAQGHEVGDLIFAGLLQIGDKACVCKSELKKVDAAVFGAAGEQRALMDVLQALAQTPDPPKGPQIQVVQP